MKKTMILLAMLAMMVSCANEHTTQTENNDEQHYFELILTLQDYVYESISLTLGDGATYRAMWAEYQNHREFYDSLPSDSVVINKR